MASSGVKRLHHADRHRLLAVVKMQKAEDLLRLVELDAFRLEMADADHLAQQVVQVFVVEADPCASSLVALQGREIAFRQTQLARL